MVSEQDWADSLTGGPGKKKTNMVSEQDWDDSLIGGPGKRKTNTLYHNLPNILINIFNYY
jgi:hypothetical protein